VTRLAARAPAGHHDELRAPDGTLRRPWREFFCTPRSRRVRRPASPRGTIERQVRDDGITYNVYSDDGRSERPWFADIFSSPDRSRRVGPH